MWLFTKHGFFSVVNAKKPNRLIDLDYFVIRARNPKHIDELMLNFPDLMDECEIPTQQQGTDYPARCIIHRKDWEALASRLADEIDYTNFKSKVALTTDDDNYLNLLHQVWRLGREYQENLEKGLD